MKESTELKWPEPKIERMSVCHMCHTWKFWLESNKDQACQGCQSQPEYFRICSKSEFFESLAFFMTRKTFENEQFETLRTGDISAYIDDDQKPADFIPHDRKKQRSEIF